MLKTLRHTFLGCLHDEVGGKETPSSVKWFSKLVAHSRSHVNHYDQGLTPLHDSLLAVNFYYAVILLQHGADPNLECRFATWQGKPIKRYIIRKDASVVKLLAIYGATKEGIEFPSESETVVHAYQVGHHLYEQKQTLVYLTQQYQHNPADNNLKQQIKSLSNELSHQLAGLASTENCSAFKDHYQRESERYKNDVTILTKKPHRSTMNPIYKLGKRFGFFHDNVKIDRETTPLLNVQITNSNQGNSL